MAERGLRVKVARRALIHHWHRACFCLFRINFYSFSMNVDIDARDNHPIVSIMALPNERLSFFNVEKLLKAQNTVSRPPARRAYSSERIRQRWPQNVHWHSKNEIIYRNRGQYLDDLNTLSDCDDISLLRYFLKCYEQHQCCWQQFSWARMEI